MDKPLTYNPKREVIVVDVKIQKEIDIHKRITDEIHNLFKSKRADYGSTTEALLEKYGPISMLTLISTKLARLDNLLLKDKKPNNESIDDTIRDMANYCIIWLLEIEKQKLKATTART